MLGGGLQPGAALVVVCLAIVTLQPRSMVPAVTGCRCLAIVTLQPRSMVPAVTGCRLVVCSVVIGRTLRSRAMAGVSLHVCVGLGPVLASHAPSPPAAAAAAWRGRGRVPIAGWSCGGVDRKGVFGGEEEGGGVRSGPGEARTILLLHIISVRPSKQPLMVRTFLKVNMELGSSFCFCKNKLKTSSSSFWLLWFLWLSCMALR